MFLRLFLISFFLLISFSCKKNDRAVITGTVIDEVTGNPVEGASVNLKIEYQVPAYFSKLIQGTTTKTDGSYAIVYEYNNDRPELGANNLPTPFPGNYYTYALASGFIGSDSHSLSDNIFDNAYLKLYHSAQINIHVKNDGINKLNEGYIWLDMRQSVPNRTPRTELYFICQGQNFDSSFIIKNAWGDVKYYYGVSSTPLSEFSVMGGFENRDVLRGSIIPKPDSITDLFISF
jgi:hypothetical protein